MDITTADILGHIGYVILTVGMLLIAHKKIAGWYFRAMGESLWIVVGLGLGLTSAWTWGLFFLGMEAYGYRTWRQKAASPNCSECGRLKDADLRV